MYNIDLINRLFKVFSRSRLDVKILLKWFVDKKVLPLNFGHFRLYFRVHRNFFNSLGVFPDLINCHGYNDKIQWLKLFDQSRLHVKCSDKLGLRDFVEERLGKGYLPELYQVACEFDDLNIYLLPSSFVLKTNHDSGSVFLFPSGIVDWSTVGHEISNLLKRKYGISGGEWMYQWIEPKVFAEENLSSGMLERLPDYKFHCCDGSIKWLQFIYDRGCDTKEVIVDIDGVAASVNFDHKMQPSDKFFIPPEWEELKRVAERLSAGFKYVRVDLYAVRGRVYVGELTFFPLKGCYKGEGQFVLGNLLDFDRNSFNALYVKDC